MSLISPDRSLSVHSFLVLTRWVQGLLHATVRSHLSWLWQSTRHPAPLKGATEEESNEDASYFACFSFDYSLLLKHGPLFLHQSGTCLVLKRSCHHVNLYHSRSCCLQQYWNCPGLLGLNFSNNADSNVRDLPEHPSLQECLLFSCPWCSFPSYARFQIFEYLEVLFVYWLYQRLTQARNELCCQHRFLWYLHRHTLQLTLVIHLHSLSCLLYQ